MANENLSLSELIGRAYARALPAKKFAQLVQARLRSRSSSSTHDSGDELASAFLPYLLPSPPSLILSYLSQLLLAGIITSRTIFIHILFYLTEHDIPSISVINSIFNILAANITGLEGPIPSFLTSPSTFSRSNDAPTIPDVGTSKSAANSPSSKVNAQSITTLSLILPLLRTISSNPMLVPNSSLVIYLSKVVSVLSNFPLPSLDIGLEVGGLLPNLPEEINAHLRDHLSGLMTDLDNQGPITQSQGPTQMQMQDGNIQQQMAQNLQDIQMGDQSSNRVIQKAPLKQSVIFLLEWVKRSSKFDENPAKGIEQSWISLLKAAENLTDEPSEFLRTLLEVGIQNLTETNVEHIEAARNWDVLVERMPRLLRWWKDHSEEGFPFPSDIADPVTSLFRDQSTAIQSYSEAIAQRYTNLIQVAENEEEGSTFTPLEGWNMPSLAESLLSKLVQLSIISMDQASTIAPGLNVLSFAPGESLINRLSSESQAHLPPLVHTIQYAFSAASSFSSEILQIIKSCPASPPPECVFTFIASQPGLLGCLTSTISSTALLAIMEKQLLDIGVEETSRNDDPQGSLTRFGEGVALVEAFVAHYQLPLPALLQDARRADSFCHLDNESKECMNGWVKAIFGSDGIEDAILLATPPQKLYALTPTLIQQAILAVATSQMDLDTLHSGLSYFSQPLLSWCLGGVVSWLCKEIKRQGLLSALHLVVLQDLILGHSCPEALIRVNAQSLNELLKDISLVDVFQSSNFDLAGIRSKLDNLNLRFEPDAQRRADVVPLKQAVQLLRQVETAPSGWEKTLFDSLERESSWNNQGTVGVLKIILQEANGIRLMGDTYLSFIPLILAIPVMIRHKKKGGCLLDTFVTSSSLTNWLNTIRPPVILDIAQILRSSLILRVSFVVQSNPKSQTAEEARTETDYLLSNLIDELEYLLSRPVESEVNAFGDADGGVDVDVNGNGNGNGNPLTSKKRKFTTSLNGNRGDRSKITTFQREIVENVVKVLRDDDELRSQYARTVSRLDQIL
ncbi:uncharacterized protein I303_106736 [Kwoniella dejecticola CBS 10117]|uniref:Mediator of RNA polymerase II transcription subunit 5 n=1 Tax=Kwoniella dejecticola CBS 10117 TaxID=1296121 RepID=A0A1A5ZTV0_9TREE|nr:uncharacterized protein I303_08621 [Kwoniella dejecticola CBS 10117]OBR81236.1 hypothetical protein I303_08621 [Kwoniella dejecticola CBS 10117]